MGEIVRPLAIFAAMNLSRLTLSVLLMLPALGSAQALEVFPSSLSFGYVTETAPDSQLVKIYNRTPTPTELNVFLSRAIYNDSAIQVVASNTTLAPFDTTEVWVKFAPQQNIDYSGNIVFANSGAAGAAVVSFQGHGRFSNNYYSSTEGLSEQALKDEFAILLAQNFNSLSYNAARDNMYATLDNVNGQVECVYTGRTATFNDRAGANNNNFNCEHTFPQGFFSQAQPMRADIHHLFPTDASTNSRRSNHPFGVVTNPSWTGGGSKYGNSTFEPRDAHKGAAARAMMYFVIRYQDYANFFAPQENILLQWHESFPPSAFEEGRNQGIFQLQNNRNPFVDYPQFADRINDFVANSAAPVNFDLAFVNDTVFMPYDPTQGHLVTFRTAVLNTGNQPVFVAPQAFTDTIIQFANGTETPITLLPGESKVIDLQAPHNYIFDEGMNTDVDMEILTNLPAGTITIPVRTQSFPLSTLEGTSTQLFLYPNPASQTIHIPSDIDKIEIIDQMGRVVMTSEEDSVRVSTLPVGQYFVKMYQDEVVSVQTLIIARD